MQLQHAVRNARGFRLAVRADCRAGTHLALLHRPRAARTPASSSTILMMAIMSAALAAPVRRARRRLVVVATFIRPAATAAAAAAAGHSPRIVVAPSAVVRPLDPLRRRGLPLRSAQIGLEV